VKYFTTCWRWNRHRVPKRRLIMFGRRGNTQKTIFHFTKYLVGGICLSNSRLFYDAAAGSHAFPGNTSNSWEFAIGVSECTEMIYWCIGNGIRHMSYTDQLLTFITALKVSAVVYSHVLTLRITSLLKQRIAWNVKLKLFNFNQS